MTPIEPFLDTAHKALQSAHDALNADILDYPTPISGCDAQFNHMLAQRSRVHNALRALIDDVFVPTPRSPNQNEGIESR
jgi:hypothetical protein